MNTDRIVKSVVLAAQRETVWRALTDSARYGAWFGARFEGPFVAGKPVVGRIEPTQVDPEVAALQEPMRGVPIVLFIEAIEPMTRFAFRWHPYAVETERDYADEPTTLVEFVLTDAEGGVLLDDHGVGIRCSAARAAWARARIERGRLGAPEPADRPVSLARGIELTLPPASVAAVGAFAALGDPLRLGIVARLCTSGPLPTVALREGTGVTRQAVDKHLRVLEAAGILRSERIGRDRAWHVEPARLAATRASLDQLAARWDERLARLKALVEEGA